MVQNLVVVMDELVYNTLCSYYNELEKTGYTPMKDVKKVLVLCFYKDFVFNDYRGYLTKEDYSKIERVLDCLWGSTCLIPYPDYLKMGKLHLGETTELAQRIKTIEDTSVLKLMNADGTNDSDVIITVDDEE